MTLADPLQGNPRIVRRLEHYFRDKNIASDTFSRHRPAAHFLGVQATLWPCLDPTALERAKKLLRRASELLPGSLSPSAGTPRASIRYSRTVLLEDRPFR